MFLTYTSIFCVAILAGNAPVQGCSGQVNISATNIDQYFTSPGFPSTPYTSNLACSWKITSVNEGRKVGVEFMDVFLEDSGGCINDAIDVYDGSSATSPHLLKFCGSLRPKIESSGDALFVEFKSNGAVEAKGFRARFYNLPVNEPVLSFEAIVAIIGALTLLILLIIFIVACAHKNWSKKLKDKISKLSMDNQVVPLKTTDSYPILPNKPVKKRDVVLTIDKDKASSNRQNVPNPRDREEQALRQLRKERNKVANIPVPKRAEIDEGPSTSKGKVKISKKAKQEIDVKDYPILPDKKGAKPYSEPPASDMKPNAGDKRKVPAHLTKPGEKDNKF